MNQRALADVEMMHNHPSGDPSPSKADIAITQEIVKAASVMKTA